MARLYRPCARCVSKLQLTQRLRLQARLVSLLIWIRMEKLKNEALSLDRYVYFLFFFEFLRVFQTGTTVTLTNLFISLPVRRKEFERNAKREFGKALSLLNAYALGPCSAGSGVRLTVSNQPEKGYVPIFPHLFLKYSQK